MPNYHPEPDELLEYATGTSTEPVSLLVACHLTLCPECREEVRLLDDVGGALLDAASVAAEPSERVDAPDAALAAMAEVSAGSQETSGPNRADELGVPRPLAAFFEEEDADWRFLVPGARHVPLTLSIGDCPVRLIRFAPGYTIRQHEHLGAESLLVFDGAIRDLVTDEVFHSGDISRRETGIVHAQRVEPDAPCVCLVLNYERIRPTSPIGRFLAWLAGV